ncbi:hypothetical protein NUM3379_34380 [Kineococcus sp. NUM-3379]
MDTSTTARPRHASAEVPTPRRRRGRLVAGALALVLAGGAAGWTARGALDPAPPAAPNPGAAQAPSQGAAPSWMPNPHVPAAERDTKWTCTQTHTVSDVAAFEQYLGRPVDCVVVFSTDKDWGTLTLPWFAVNSPEGKDWGAWVGEAPEERTLVISQSLVPNEPPSDWRARGAAGEYDRYWRQFGQTLVDEGLGRSVIRLGWEFNGDWYENHYVGASAEEREQWKEYWRRAVRALEVPGSQFEIDFNLAEGLQNSVAVAELYPGDEYVDIIGVDVYDSYLAPIDPSARNQARNAKENGVADLVAFAREHDKPLSLPEWAMVSPDSGTQGGGDNPVFIDQMADFVRDNPVRYQGYFNVPDGGVGMTLADAPQGSARFLERFGPSGDAAPTGS